MKLKDKVVVITGGSEGLGKAIALLLAKEGAKLALIARNKEKLQKVKEEIERLGAECEYFVCDISDDNQVGKSVREIVRRFKKIDILINGAGIWWEGPLEKHSAEKVKELFMINVIGLINITREVVPIMKTRKEGQILNISSIAGIEPNADWGTYTGTKYAVRGFTDSLKLELKGTGIKVMGFYPGGMDTNIFDAAGFHYGKASWMMKKEDIAEIILFILTRPGDVMMDHVEVRKF